jgi:hypothetical protein
MAREFTVVTPKINGEKFIVSSVLNDEGTMIPIFYSEWFLNAMKSGLVKKKTTETNEEIREVWRQGGSNA